MNVHYSQRPGKEHEKPTAGAQTPSRHPNGLSIQSHLSESITSPLTITHIPNASLCVSPVQRKSRPTSRSHHKPIKPTDNPPVTISDRPASKHWQRHTYTRNVCFAAADRNARFHQANASTYLPSPPIHGLTKQMQAYLSQSQSPIPTQPA
jgi:hypothetical protein